MKRILTAGLMFFAALAHAQGYPSKPVKLIVSSAAGGSPDLQARIFTQRMTKLYGYIWVIENLPGAGGNIAPERAAKSPADGYTLLMASAGPLYFNPTLYTKLSYDIQRDFEPITQVSNVPNILAVHPSVPFNSVKELIAYARANPGKLRFGSPGSGSSQHLSGELFKKMAGVDMQHVPYKSVSQMTTELVSGQFEISFNNAPLVLPFMKAGRLRALAVTTRTRLALAPEVPTLDESGLPGFEVGGGSGLLAPKGTPSAILKKLETDVCGVLTSPEVREQYAANGLIAVGSSSAEFAAYMKEEIARWAPLIRATGASVD
ncbi:MAG TPA: tripartite tricarboxylate transporter substrate binding protein [Burkholderiales bacterium]|nr:tripartite tricarboxylate transporter substrate binding protein [Burkholderiales bacterium]